MVSERRRRPPRRFAGVTVLASAALLLVLLPVVSTAVAPFPARAVPSVAGCAGTPTRHGISANVLWNGANVCSYTSASSSLGVDFSQTEHIQFNWTSVGGSPVSVNTARLEMFYFGFALATRDQISSQPQTRNGTFDMTWTPGALTYVLEGLYGLTASLIAPNGTSLWSEDFFVTATAPYSILAALPIVLLVIAIYEAYSLARSGREEAVGRGPAPPPPSEPAEAAPPPSSPESEETGPPGAEPPPPEDETPPPEETSS